MTELDHTSFDTLVADLSRRGGVFRFKYSCGGISPQWIFDNLSRCHPLSQNLFFIEIEYGSVDNGTWVLDEWALHQFSLRNGYLGDIGSYDDQDDKIKIVLDSTLSSTHCTDDQLNENLRGVFG